MVELDQTIPGKRSLRSQGIYEIGDVLQGRFEILGSLGKGGMGVVYRCMDKLAGIEVAIKTLSPELSASGWEMEEIKENFQLVYNLHHPYIANYNSLEKDDASGNYFLVMEYVDGEDLRYYLRRQKKEGHYSEELVIRLIRQIADALDYAHANKIIHRDIKPANIFVDSNGNIKLLDFGLAAQIHTSLSRVSVVKNDDTSGTVPYMSPEQWLCMHPQAASDQYALAATLYEIFSGAPPFDSPDKDNVRHCVLNVEPAPLQNVSPSIAKAVAKALSKKPEDRFPNCNAFADALTNTVIPDVVVTEKEQTASNNTNNNRKYIAVIIGLIVCFAVYYMYDTNSESVSPQPAPAAQPVSAPQPAPAPQSIPAPQPAPVTYATEAENKYRKAAEDGDATAQYNLGECYYYGRDGLNKDYAEAGKWFRKAADRGNVIAQYNLGVCYANGRGVEKNDTEAVKWYRKAAEQGHASAQYNLGVCYRKGCGVTQNYSEAAKWYRKAADQGHASAQNNLGVCYELGRGVEKDYTEAVKWYRKAADQGNASAQYNLGVSYENGQGVTQDYTEAVKWYRKAADQGDADARENLKRLASRK